MGRVYVWGAACVVGMAMVIACGSSVDVNGGHGAGTAEGGAAPTPSTGGSVPEADAETAWQDYCDCYATLEDKTWCLWRESKGLQCLFEHFSADLFNAHAACCEGKCTEDEYESMFPKTDAFLEFQEACQSINCNVDLPCEVTLGAKDETYEAWTSCLKTSPCPDVIACFPCNE